MNLRPMRAEDTEAILSMMRVFYDSPAVLHKASDDLLRQDIADCVGDCPYLEGFVMTDGDTPVGYAMAAKSYSTEYGGLCVWLEDIYLLPAYQDRGLGAELLRYVEAQFDAVRFRLEVERSNTRAQALYRKLGYAPLPYIEMTREP